MLGIEFHLAALTISKIHGQECFSSVQKMLQVSQLRIDYSGFVNAIKSNQRIRVNASILTFIHLMFTCNGYIVTEGKLWSKQFHCSKLILTVSYS